MSSSKKPADAASAPWVAPAAPAAAPAPFAPFAASGGLRAAPPAPGGDPFGALDALMSVIEALCPEWPERPVPVSGGGMRL